MMNFVLVMFGILSAITSGQECENCLACCAGGFEDDCAIQDCTNPWDGPCDDPFGMSCGYFISICCANGTCCGNLFDIEPLTLCLPIGFNICHAVVCLFDKCDDLPDWLDDLFDNLFSFSSDSDSDSDDDARRRRLAKAEMKRRLASDQGNAIDDLWIMFAEKYQNERR